VIDAPTFVAAALAGVAASAALAVAAWIASVKLRDVSIVDSVWSLLVFVPAAVAAAVLDGGPRTAVVLGLSGLWALRLAAYITWRHWGEPEDRRYQAIRARNQPRFELKSLYLVFGLQALLGAIVALPLQAAVASTAPWQALDGLGLAVFAAGFAFEAVADAQLARFKADPAQRGRVLDRGLWRFSRHPNYFGECCVWWGLWLVALASGAWWTVVSPLLMTLLLLKVSGVTLLEQDIGERRPDYTDYVARTNAFLPGRPRT
jgi:steroid 5-alpha reductase family enzyme